MDQTNYRGIQQESIWFLRFAFREQAYYTFLISLTQTGVCNAL
jgi:hypothetical protein